MASLETLASALYPDLEPLSTRLAEERLVHGRWVRQDSNFQPELA